MEIVVLGMHRAGTSLVASLLEAMGVHMGTDLLPPDAMNPQGYYEDRDFVNFNGYVLRVRGYRWSRPPPDAALAMMADYFEPRAAELTAAKAAPLWGWKDPRTTLLWQMYHPYLSDPHYVTVRRRKRAVIASLQNRAKFCADQLREAICRGETVAPDWKDWLAEGTWQHHDWMALCKRYDDALKAHARECDAPKLHMNYDHLIHKYTTQKQVQELADFIGYEDEITSVCDRIQF